MTTEETERALFQQLAKIKHRLESFPWANHEAKCLRDCLLVLIRTVAGEVIEEGQTAQVPAGDSIVVNNQRFYGGQEIAPGVMVYQQAGGVEGGTPMPARAPGTDDRGGALVDISAGMPYHPVTNPRGIKPVPGSVMAQAMGIPDPEPVSSEQGVK